VPRRGREVIEQLKSHVLTPQEAQQRRYGSIPELRLRPDLSVVAAELDPLRLAQLLTALEAGQHRNAIIEDRETRQSGVVVPVSRYVGLIAIELATDDFRALSDGRLEPAGLADSEVEQTNPKAAWLRAP
jgi:hypothetical protein